MAERKYDVTALGELLIDFTENGNSEQGNPLMEANPGGAPCNMLSMIQKLGGTTAFIGKVGKDMFGRQLRQAVESVGIDTRNLMEDEEVHTTLAFVHTFPDGDRDFSFYRNPGADMMLTKEEIQEDLIRNYNVFGGQIAALKTAPQKMAMRLINDRAALKGSVEAGVKQVYGGRKQTPMTRMGILNLFQKTLEDARKEIEYGLSKTDILKISDNEVEFLCGTSDYDEGAKMLIEKYNIPFVCVTLGKDGSRAYYKGMRVDVPGFVQKNTIETTGAGDTFCGCMLHYIIQHGLEDLTEENLRELLTFANAAASVITTRKGALAVMPSKEEVEELLRE